MQAYADTEDPDQHTHLCRQFELVLHCLLKFVTALNNYRIQPNYHIVHLGFSKM